MRAKDFKKITNKLRRKFELKEDGTDHVAFDICMNGIWITQIKNSHSPKDWQDKLIARNLHISRTNLQSFIECNFSNDDLIAKIKEKGYWPSDIRDDEN